MTELSGGSSSSTSVPEGNKNMRRIRKCARQAKDNGDGVSDTSATKLDDYPFLNSVTLAMRNGFSFVLQNTTMQKSTFRSILAICLICLVTSTNSQSMPGFGSNGALVFNADHYTSPNAWTDSSYAKIIRIRICIN